MISLSFYSLIVVVSPWAQVQVRLVICQAHKTKPLLPGLFSGQANLHKVSAEAFRDPKYDHNPEPFAHDMPAKWKVSTGLGLFKILFLFLEFAFSSCNM